MRCASLSIITVSFVSLALAGCDKKTDQPPAAEGLTIAASAGEPASAHGRPGAQPGTHDDWCGGHRVPESLCTRCNPSLIAAFKATGDWCEEHALPESQCLLCNPDLKIERPPRTGEGSP